MKIIIVTDKPKLWKSIFHEIDIIEPIQYINNQNLPDHHTMRVINLCHSYNYQSLGYYVSLLAEAREDKVIPSVLTMQDIKSRVAYSVIATKLENDIQQAFHSLQSTTFTLSIYFGKNIAKKYNALCRKLYGLLPLPLFRVYFAHKKIWQVQKIESLSLNEIPDSHKNFLIDAANDFFSKKRFYTMRKKNIYYDMAILYDPNEKTPPSDTIAIEKFSASAAKLGIQTELITKDDSRTLNEYDALFIRETTSVNSHTYHFARRAAAERLVVIDDPVSILKCTNKVYLAELLKKNHINTPLTTILNKHDYLNNLAHINYPCVIKKPDSSFSQGVVKADDQEELIFVLKEFFKSSDLIIIQEFMPSEYDWRIGIIDHQPLYACRYYMAKEHWQIMNWQSTRVEEGDTETIPIEEVPSNIIETTLKTTRLIGDGLYGVDIKQIDGKNYVIEVNDNPSIDHEVEDKSLGDELYLNIMKVFLKRMNQKHGYSS